VTQFYCQMAPKALLEEVAVQQGSLAFGLERYIPCFLFTSSSSRQTGGGAFIMLAVVVSMDGGRGAMVFGQTVECIECRLTEL
jgi:hypothetical protein